jgi:cell division protein FtsZ
VGAPLRHEHNGAAPAGEPAAPAERATSAEPAGRPPRTVTFDENDDLDVPDFLK